MALRRSVLRMLAARPYGAAAQHGAATRAPFSAAAAQPARANEEDYDKFAHDSSRAHVNVSVQVYTKTRIGRTPG
jgi:hypothetical protein